MINTDALIKLIDSHLNLNRSSYALKYDDLLSNVINNLMNKGYEFDSNNKLMLSEQDQGFDTIRSYSALVHSQVTIDSNFKVPSLRDVSYLGTHLSELQTVLARMGQLQMQEECESSLVILKQKFPQQMIPAVNILLYMLLFYDLGLRFHAALMATIAFYGIYDDIPKEGE